MGKKSSNLLDTKNGPGLNDTNKSFRVNWSEDLYNLLDQLPVSVLVFSAEGSLVKYNERAKQVLGAISVNVNASDWFKHFRPFTNPQNSPLLMQDFPVFRALQGETVDGEEYAYVGEDSMAEKWITVSAKPYTSSNGNVIGAIVIISDITQSKEVYISHQRRLKLAESAYSLQQQIAEVSNDPRKILEKVVKFAAENIGDGCIAALLNIRADKLRVVAIKHIKPAADALLYKTVESQEFGLETAISNVIKTGEPLLIPEVDQSRLRNITQPGQLRYLDEVGLQSMIIVPIKGHNRTLGTLSVIRDRGGTPYTSKDLSYLTDIAYRTGQAIDNNFLINLLQKESSGRKNAEHALEQSEVRFQSIFKSTALGIKVLDLEGNILETNPAFQNMLRYSEDELRGKPIADFWHKSDVEHFFQMLEKLNTENVQSIQLEHRLISKDDSIVWVNVTFTRIKKSEQDDSFPFIVAIAENITQRKRIEAEMSKMKIKLQSHVEFERLRLAQELHDGPLQDLYSTIFKIESWGNSSTPEVLEKFVTIKQDLQVVINGLRNTAKDLRPPTLAEYGLEKAIRSYVDEFHENYPDLSIHLDLASDEQYLPEDVRLILFRICQHLMTNILRHAQAREIDINFYYDAEAAYLIMRDDGVGFKVPANWVDLVMQGHYGLAGEVERVTLLGGQFQVESSPGEGTTIKAVLPLSADNNQPNETGEQSDG